MSSMTTGVSTEIRASLSVCIDFRNPHAWLAVPPTLALAEELGVAIDWLPRIVAPIERPPAVQPMDGRGARHRRHRAEYAARDLERYAAVHGLPLRGLDRRPDTTLASLGLLWARHSGAAVAERYVTRVFSGFFSETLDLEARAALRSVLEASGADPGFDAFAEGEGPGVLEALQVTLADEGVFAVPAYRIQGQCFIGRAHLPWIRALLGGQAVL